MGRNVLITGVSSGIGHGLASHYLDTGFHVFGTSRRTPKDLVEKSGFAFVAADLSNPAGIDRSLSQLLTDTSHLELVVLNAGVLGQFGDLLESEPTDLEETMQVNVWANVALLNGIYNRQIQVDQVVAISSGASVNGNRGWSGYSISKAALNMLVKLYSHEQPETHFCALAPGLVDTPMQDLLCDLDPDDRFPAVEVLRSKRNTPEMPIPAVAALQLAQAIKRLPDVISSGEYADVRHLPV